MPSNMATSRPTGAPASPEFPSARSRSSRRSWRASAASTIPADTRRVVGDVAGAGFDSFNIDLIYGLPGQSEAAALADLECAIGLAPPHISWYQLTIEPKTEFARRPPKGLPSGDKAAAIEEAGVALLARHGYHRYEVSAYARDGHQCAHNVNYWRFGDYFGIGAGAHGKITSKEGVVRTTKPRQPRLYLAEASVMLSMCRAANSQPSF